MNEKNKKTKIIQDMEQMLSQLDPESPRFELLKTAKKFKSNWLDLGDLLSKNNNNKEYLKWGYSSFDQYIQKELKIKNDTAFKLMASFQYLKKYKPELTDSKNIKSIPDYRIIHQMSELENNDELSSDSLEELRKEVFEFNAGPKKIKKKISELDGSMYNNEDDVSHEEQMIDKMKKALQQLKKILPVFEPSQDVIRSMETVENFLNEVTNEEE